MLWIMGDTEYTALINALNALSRKIDTLSKKVEVKMSDFDEAMRDLTEQVAKNTDAEQSAIALISKLADTIEEAAGAGDVAAVAALAGQLKSSADALGAAIVANTPSQVVPEPEPEPTPTP